jgi:hypothetical protein
MKAWQKLKPGQAIPGFLDCCKQLVFQTSNRLPLLVEYVN